MISTESLLYCHNLGWAFTPLNGKRPILRGWTILPRATIEQVLEWASTHNIGVRTGRISGIVVIDIDPGANLEGLEFPETVTVLSGRPGAMHLYYKYRPIQNGRIRDNIEVKSDGAQVVFPGSVHPETGAMYRWAPGKEPWSISFAELPESIITMISKNHEQKTTDQQTSRYVASIVNSEIAAVATAKQGERNNRLNKAAFTLGQLVASNTLDEKFVETNLLQAAIESGLNEHEAIATIQSGLNAGKKSPRYVDQQNQHTNDVVLIPGIHSTPEGIIEQSTARFAEQVIARLPQNIIYRRDTIPCELIGNPGNRTIEKIAPDRMRLIIDQYIKLVKIESTKTDTITTYKPCSKDSASLVLAQATVDNRVRELVLKTSYPVYNKDFKLCRPGWNNGIYYDEPQELRRLSPVCNIHEIREVLYDLVVDFPFKTDADIQNFFGLLLTPIITPAIEGNRPMHLVNSPLERTGKTKLINEVLGYIILGHSTASMQITESEEEREKRILSILLEGDTIIHLDNLPPYIDSPSLASLLTTHIFRGRVLGISRTISLPNYLTIIGTGNNVTASSEIAKRIIPIMLEPRTASPEYRKDYVHPDIADYVKSRKTLIVSCLVGMVENWIKSGKPKSSKRLGGFESWSEIVGGILEVNGFLQWRENEIEWRQSANPYAQELLEFVQTWYSSFGNSQVSSAQLKELAGSKSLFNFIFAKQTEKAVAVAFGKLMNRLANMPIGQWFIRKYSSGTSNMFFLEPIGEQAAMQPSIDDIATEA